MILAHADTLDAPTGLFCEGTDVSSDVLICIVRRTFMEAHGYM